MLEQCLSNTQKKPLQQSPKATNLNPIASGYTICGAGFAALAKMVFERIAGLPFQQSSTVRFLIINTCSFKGFHFFTRRDL